MVGVSLVSIPLTLRAGLQQDFAAAFSLDYVKQFVGLMWREMILTSVFLIGTSVLLQFAGMLLCIVGIYPAMAIWMFASVHLHYQLYELYLQRGGTPIPLKDEPVGPPPL